MYLSTYLTKASVCRSCAAKFLVFQKMGCHLSTNIITFKSASRPSNLELKMVEALKKRGATRKCSFKTFNSVILKFPKLDQSFEEVRTVFKNFDEDGNGSIDRDELKKCFQDLKVSFTNEEIEELYRECDMNEDKGIDFKEFIVLLALVYLAIEERPEYSSKEHVLWHDLQEAFDTIVDAFIYFDKDTDGYITIKEMVQALNETSPGEEATSDVALQRFKEMDWNKNGKITFKEMLFAYTDWVGIEDGEE